MTARVQRGKFLLEIAWLPFSYIGRMKDEMKPSPLDLIQIALATGLLKREDIQYKDPRLVRDWFEPKLREALENAAHIYGIAYQVASAKKNDPIQTRLESQVSQDIARMWRYELSSEKIAVEKARLIFGYKAEENFLKALQRFGYYHKGDQIHRQIVDRFKAVKEAWDRELVVARQKRHRHRLNGEPSKERKFLTGNWIYRTLGGIVEWPTPRSAASQEKRQKKRTVT